VMHEIIREAMTVESYMHGSNVLYSALFDDYARTEIVNRKQYITFRLGYASVISVALYLS